MAQHNIKILLAEADTALRITLLEQLAAEADFDAHGTATIADTEDRLAENIPDLLLLDTEMPDGDARAFCRRLRLQGHNFPVLMLTPRNDEAGAVDGLEAGANDALAKPLRLRELVARIRAHARQYRARADIRIMLGPFTFSPGGKTLSHRRSGEVVFLTEKEAALLRYLDGKNGARAGREELLREVWGYNEAAHTHTLETHIYRLRRKIAEATGDDLLITDNGGYGLAG